MRSRAIGKWWGRWNCPRDFERTSASCARGGSLIMVALLDLQGRDALGRVEGDAGSGDIARHPAVPDDEAEPVAGRALAIEDAGAVHRCRRVGVGHALVREAALVG